MEAAYPIFQARVDKVVWVALCLPIGRHLRTMYEGQVVRSNDEERIGDFQLKWAVAL
jgi:hypothetical protein